MMDDAIMLKFLDSPPDRVRAHRAFSANIALARQMPYDSDRAYVPLAQLLQIPFDLIANPEIGSRCWLATPEEWCANGYMDEEYHAKIHSHRGRSAGTYGRVAAALGTDYPSRPVRVVIPFAAGAGTDLSGRIVAQELTKHLGQQFVVENKPGAAAQLGTDLVAKSQSDGYTLLWTVTDGLSVLPAVKVSVPYKIPDDFAFIAGVLQMPFAVSVNAKLPVKSVADLVAYAKANPGKLNFGSAGVGSAPHMGFALMSAAAGIKAAACSLSDISGWRDGVLYPLAGGGRGKCHRSY